MADNSNTSFEQWFDVYYEELRTVHQHTGHISESAAREKYESGESATVAANQFIINNM